MNQRKFKLTNEKVQLEETTVWWTASRMGELDRWLGRERDNLKGDWIKTGRNATLRASSIVISLKPKYNQDKCSPGDL